jgi:hypothetical protein
MIRMRIFSEGKAGPEKSRGRKDSDGKEGDNLYGGLH